MIRKINLTINICH